MSIESKNKKSYDLDVLMRLARMRKFGDIHTKIDHETGLRSIIAVHNVDLGPAIGGCRFYPYTSTGQALKDALDLSYMMTIKAAVNNLPHGGAKAVIIKPSGSFDRQQLFESYGDFVHELNGRYITACDLGTSTKDMDVIATRTPYVIGAASNNPIESDPATHTALGVFQGIRAAVKFRMQRDDLEGLTVNVQGAGHVGYYLCKHLHEQGAIINICDPNAEKLQKIVDEFNTTAVAPDDIYGIKADVFAPCALGGIINYNTINLLQTCIVAGSANSQLAHKKYATMLAQKDILYVPDFVINSGGLINAAYVYDCQDAELATQHIYDLYERLLNIFDRANKEHKTTQAVAFQMAIERLNQARSENLRPFEKVLASSTEEISPYE